MMASWRALSLRTTPSVRRYGIDRPHIHFQQEMNMDSCAERKKARATISLSNG